LRGPASVPDVMSGRSAQWCWDFVIELWLALLFVAQALGLVALSPCLTLSLLVARIRADHHDPPMPTDHPALVANGLDARVHLHGCVDPSVLL